MDSATDLPGSINIMAFHAFTILSFPKPRVPLRLNRYSVGSQIKKGPALSQICISIDSAVQAAEHRGVGKQVLLGLEISTLQG